MTKTFKLITVSAAALIAGAAHAQSIPQSVIDAVVADLSAQGFTRIEIDVERNRLDVDAYGANIEGDFYYTRSGELISADIDESSSGQSVAGIGVDYDDGDDYDDDDDYDDRDDDDYDDGEDYDDDDGDDHDDGDDDDGDEDYDDD